MGRNGLRYTADTTAVTGNFCAIYCVTSTVFTTLTAETGFDGTTITGVTFPAGTWIFSPITAYTLTSGSVFAYRGTTL